MNRRSQHPMRTYFSIVALSSALVSAACSKKSELREHVDQTCTIVATDLDHAATKYEEFAAWAGGRTPDETWERQELSLPCRWRLDARGACAVQLAARLQACVNAKNADEKTIEDVKGRANVAFDRFGVSADPTVVANAMREISSIASSVRQMKTME